MKKTGIIGKRIIAAMLAVSLTAGLAGCGEKKSDDKTDKNPLTTAAIINQITENGVDNGQTKADIDVYEETVCDGMAYETDCIDPGYPLAPEWNTNEYNDLAENPWQLVKNEPLSTFAADVDTASYSQIRTNIMNGYDVDPGMVRLEEMINYFHYDYKNPAKGEKFGVYTEYADCPWSEDTKLALVAMNTTPIDFSEAPESNIVFLIDTSGSMFEENKLPLVQKSLCMLAENFTEKDRISIVTYAGNDTVVLQGAKGNDYKTITSAIEALEAGGSTNGSAGINTAYELAEKYFIKGGNNRVILATDGDLNVGVTSETELTRLIEKKRETGVFLSVIGVGNGNYKDNKLEALADNGNGNYAYIDSIFEAKKALVDNFGASMVTVAKDVKLQVEFNPANVKGYRLLGYENRVMAAEDFNDDTKDGGEMGAGHVVTAVYEIALADSKKEIADSSLKYQQDNNEEDIRIDLDSKNFEDEIFTLNIRYKEVDADKSQLETYVCTKKDYSQNGSDNLRWAAAAAAFGMYLKDSEYKGSIDKKLILKLADSCDYEDDDLKKEFVELVKMSSNSGKEVSLN